MVVSFHFSYFAFYWIVKAIFLKNHWQRIICTENNLFEDNLILSIYHSIYIKYRFNPFCSKISSIKNTQKVKANVFFSINFPFSITSQCLIFCVFLEQLLMNGVLIHINTYLPPHPLPPLIYTFTYSPNLISFLEYFLCEKISGCWWYNYK